MQPAKVSIAVALFAYGGNGGTASLIPEIAIYLAKIWHQLKLDPRVDRLGVQVYADTPVTMTRNRAVRDAKAMGFDMLLMLDSDNEPDAYVGIDPTAKPFMDVAFDFAYERLLQGLPTFIAAPYCGPPPHPVPKPGVTDGGEVPYLFEWTNDESDSKDAKFRIALLTRLEATRLKGIFPVAALPTGVCLSTLNAYEPLPKPYFKYEMNEDHSEKWSTEDVVATRDISLYWKMTKGIDVIFAACDSWALHHKPKRVGKPKVVMLESIAQEMREAILNHHSGLEEKRVVDYSKDLPRKGQILRPDQDQIVLTDEDLRIANAVAEQDGRDAWEVLEQAMEEHGQRTGLTELVESQVVSGSEADDEVEDEASDESGHKSNGFVLRHKMVSGRKVAIIGDDLSSEDQESLMALTGWVVSHKDDNPIEAAVVHCGTGQGMAVIQSILPPGSHLHGIDNTALQPHGSDIYEQLSASFANEVSSGSVVLNTTGRQLPKRKYDLDFVFLEQFVTTGMIERWIKYVSPGGVLAGRGDVWSAEEYAKENGLVVKTSGSIWAIPVGVAADAL